MRCETIDICIDYGKIEVDNGGYQPRLTLYLPDNSPEIRPNWKRPMVVVCPGGGYAMTSDREAEPIALKFVSAGFNAAVLRYSCLPAAFPAALFELSKAVETIRANAEEWHVDPNRIVVCGFSAGGHLCASFCTLWNKDFVKAYFGYQGGENKPNGMILGYPVITSGEKAHRGSIENLLQGRANDSDLLRLVSPEKQVGPDTPPAFIWHTFTDDAVPVENSLMMALAMAEKKISAELHVFPRGVHGLGLANEVTTPDGLEQLNVPECQEWMDLAIRWVRNL